MRCEKRPHASRQHELFNNSTSNLGRISTGAVVDNCDGWDRDRAPFSDNEVGDFAATSSPKKCDSFIEFCYARQREPLSKATNEGEEEFSAWPLGARRLSRLSSNANRFLTPLSLGRNPV